MVIKSRNLFRITRFLLLKLPLLFKFIAKLRAPQKRLLIIKTDAIGDYILFRNFIEVLKLSGTYNDYRVDVLGNILWQDIALEYDAQFVDEFIFTRPVSLYEAPLKVFKMAWRLYKANYETVLQPAFTRTFINDALAGFTAAKQIIGFESNTESIAARYKTRTDKFYTQLLVLPTGIYFEFERSKFFFENVLNSVISLSSSSLPAEKTGTGAIIVFPGAGVPKREWGKNNFLELITLIKQHTQKPVYLAGGPAEMETAAYLTANLPQGSVINLTGQSTLPQLIGLIGQAALVIANETSAIHIAVATKTKSVCILGGGHFERFTPYPAYFEYRPVCVYHKMECYYCNWDCIFKTGEMEPYPCIANVNLSAVWQQVLPLLPQ